MTDEYWKKRHQGLNPLDVALQPTPPSQMAPQRTPNGEVDLDAMLMSRVLGGQGQRPTQVRDMATNSPVTCRIREGAPLFRKLEYNSFGGDQSIVVFSGNYENMAVKEFELGQVSRCMILENHNKAIDLSNPHDMKTANLVKVSAMFVGTFYVHENSIVRNTRGQRTHGVLNG